MGARAWSNGPSLGHGPGWLDVRVPLQYAVVEGGLVLPPKSKRGLRGFAAVGGAEGGEGAARLWVRYELRGSVGTVVVDDEEAVEIR